MWYKLDNTCTTSFVNLSEGNAHILVSNKLFPLLFSSTFFLSPSLLLFLSIFIISPPLLFCTLRRLFPM